jgi:hypothetical protein
MNKFNKFLLSTAFVALIFGTTEIKSHENSCNGKCKNCNNFRPPHYGKRKVSRRRVGCSSCKKNNCKNGVCKIKKTNNKTSGCGCCG